MGASREQGVAGIAPEAGLDVRPLSGHVGAEIFGVDLSRPLESGVVAAIREAWLRWKAVFFRDQDLAPDQLLAFARLFGETERLDSAYPSTLPEHPEVLALDYEAYRSAKIEQPAELPPMPGELWHIDESSMPKPPRGTLMYGVTIPPYGGNTWFTNLVAAYEHLSEPVQRLVEGLHAVHRHLQFGHRSNSAVHPLVCVHPETREKILFVNPMFTSHFVELSSLESRHLLELLVEHVSRPTFMCQFRWQPGSVAFWDNRAVAHLIPKDVPAGYGRFHHHVSLRGDVTTGPDGFTSYLLT